MTRVPIRGGIIGSEETGEVKAGISDTEAEAEGEGEVEEQEEKVDLWVFAPPEELKRGGKALWDERVAVVALLEHKATGRPFLAACTHLAHSQVGIACVVMHSCKSRMAVSQPISHLLAIPPRPTHRTSPRRRRCARRR